MKVLIFGARNDEFMYFEQFNKRYNLEINFSKDNLTVDNTKEITKGYEAIWIVTVFHIDREITKILKENGVKYIVSRAAGTDHMDLQSLKEYGIKVANVPFYAPNAIAEHTILLTLSLLRNFKKELDMVNNQIFTLDGLRGKQLGSMTVGVLGTGRIGSETIKMLKGFGSKVLAFDLYANDDIKKYAEYVSEERILTESDILIFHCPLTKSNYHIINEDSIKKLKDGVLLVNTARGGLFDFEAVLKGLKNKKINGLAFDVYENEQVFLRKDFSNKDIEDLIFKELLSLENVIFTAHMGFFTNEAIASMIDTSLSNLYEYEKTGCCKNEVIK